MTRWNELGDEFNEFQFANYVLQHAKVARALAVAQKKLMRAVHEERPIFPMLDLRDSYYFRLFPAGVSKVVHIPNMNLYLATYEKLFGVVDEA